MIQVLKESFNFTRNHFGAMCRVLAPFILLQLVIGLPFGSISQEATMFYFLLIAIVQPFYMCRLIRYMNWAVTGEAYNPKVTFKEWRDLFVVYLLYGLAVILGLMALILPGILFGARLGYAEFDQVLKNVDPVESLKKSWVDTKDSMMVLVQGFVLMPIVPIIVDMPLAAIAKTNPEFSIATDVISLVVSISAFIFMTVFFFRNYTIANEKRAA